MIKVLVIGDMMLDKYTVGDVNRISPEAPVPIVKKNKGYSVLGGCGNVIRNLSSLNCEIYCKSIIGNDYYGDVVKHKLQEIPSFKDDFIETSLTYKTTLKHRIIADYRSTQMIRIDSETQSPIITFSNNEIEHLKTLNIDIIIISDYNKGTITIDIMDQIRKLNIPFIVDPKPENIALYRDAFVITPNENEYEQLLERDLELVLNCKYYIKTMGSQGILILNSNFEQVSHINANPVEIFNVSGAGDTVISIIGYCIAKNNSIETSCHIANECAHYVVTKPDTSIVPSDLFKTIYVDCGGV